VISKENLNEEIIIYDVIGKEIWRTDFSKTGTYAIENLENFAQGIYTVKIISDIKVQSIKLVKNN